MEKKMKTIISVVIIAAVAVLSVYTVYNLNGNSMDLSDRQVKLIITGSMDDEPRTQYDIETIPVNSLVMIKEMSDDEIANDLEVGDVIAFNSGNIIITHRIVSIDESNERITTQGDANAGVEYVAYSNVIGEVVGVNHWLGVIVHILQDYTISIILATVAVVSAGVAVKSSMKIMKEEKEAKAAEQAKDE